MKSNQKGLGAVLIIVVLVVLVAIGAAGYFVLRKSGDVASNAVSSVVESAETKKALDECKKAYSDEDLCKALSNFIGLKQYQTTMTSSESGGLSFTIEVDGDKTYSKQTLNGKTIESISQGNTVYTKDNTDGKWWKQVFETPKSSITDDLKLDTNFTDEATKTTYTKIGQEACDKLTCNKYKVTETSSKDTQYIWIDTKDNLIRRMSVESSDGSKTEISYTYNKKSIDIPNNTKDASPTQSVVPMDFYSGMNSTTTSGNTMDSGDSSQSDMMMEEEAPVEE